jgi:transposase-like protein
MPIIEHKVIPNSIVCSDCWRGYNALDTSGFKHDRIHHPFLIHLGFHLLRLSYIESTKRLSV